MKERLLIIYLRDHLAAGKGGIELARRMRRENRNHPVATLMETMIPELEEEARVIRELLVELGPGPSMLKMAAAWTAEKVGRFKFNGTVLGYSPLSRIYELEGLSAGVVARQGLWRTLDQLVPRYSRLATIDIKGYADRADRQMKELIELHRQVARETAGMRPAPTPPEREEGESRTIF